MDDRITQIREIISRANQAVDDIEATQITTQN